MNIHVWQNPDIQFDVNGDGAVSPQDALIIINYLNNVGPGPVPPDAVGPPFLDVNGDDQVTANDVLLVINFLNAASGEGEGEGDLGRFVVEADAEGEAPSLFLPSMTADGLTILPRQARLEADSDDHAHAVDALFARPATLPATLAKRTDAPAVRSADESLESLLDDLATEELASDVSKAWEEFGHDNP
jgi:hypothetical protein